VPIKLPRPAAFLPSHPRTLVRPVRSSPVRRRLGCSFSDSARRTRSWGGEMTRPGEADSMMPLLSSMRCSAFWKARSGNSSGGVSAAGEGGGARSPPKMEKRRCRGGDVGDISSELRGVLGTSGSGRGKSSETPRESDVFTVAERCKRLWNKDQIP